MSTIRPLVEQIIARWRAENTAIQPGVDDETIAEFEDLYNVRLPDDLREFYSIVNGMDDEYDEDSFSRFWRFEQIKPVNEYAPGVAVKCLEANGYFVFYDHSIDLCLHAIRLNNMGGMSNPIALIFPQTGHESLQPLWASFTEFIKRYSESPWNVL